MQQSDSQVKFQAYSGNQEFIDDLRVKADLMLEGLLLRRQLQQVGQPVNNEVDNHKLGTHRPAGISTSVETLLSQVNEGTGHKVQELVANNLQVLDIHCHTMTERLKITYHKRIFIPFMHIVNLFSLNDIEQELILLGLLPHIDEKYIELLNILLTDNCNDNTGIEESISIKLANQLISYRTMLSENITSCFYQTSALIYWQILHFSDVNRKYYEIDETIYNFMLAVSAPHLCFVSPLKQVEQIDSIDTLFLDEKNKKQLNNLLNFYHSEQEESCLLHLQGGDEKTLEAISASLLSSLKLNSYLFDCRTLWQQYLKLNKDTHQLLSQFRLCCRDALLCNNALILEYSQFMEDKSEESQLFENVFGILFESFRFVIVINGNNSSLFNVSHSCVNHQVVPFNIGILMPDVCLRQSMWMYYLDKYKLSIESDQIDKLASNYLFTEKQIEHAIKDTLSINIMQTDDSAQIQNLYKACREQSDKDLDNIAVRIKNPYSLSDIVLPDKSLSHLQEVLHYANYRHKVIEQWGFEAKAKNSKNLCVLFHGVSGTGKTMAASIIANELQQSLYRIDLSSVVSKYIGDTEKNLAHLFDQAEAMNIILFFDEAESLFGKRTASKDAHDRYANLQTGYLLQRIETYQGVVILSTNLLKNIDRAFTRRFKFIVEYPFPNTPQRLELWENAFPPDVPLNDDIDFELIAERAVLSGGSINNIAIRVAFLAAAEKGIVTMNHMLQAISQEYSKQGKVFVESEFTWYEDD